MMSGHGTNPIFFNKKIKIGRPEHSLPPTPTSDDFSFLPDTLKVDVISVSLLNEIRNLQLFLYKFVVTFS